MADKFSEALKISAKPKLTRTQPTFTPKNDIDDYELYRKFKKEFQHYISGVDKDNWEDKIQWLQRCVKDDAYRLIKEVTIDEAGYNNAFEILDTKYLCTNKIKDDIFHFIHTFFIPNTGKNHSTLSSKLISLRIYIQELTDSGFLALDPL